MKLPAVDHVGAHAAPPGDPPPGRRSGAGGAPGGSLTSEGAQLVPCMQRMDLPMTWLAAAMEPIEHTVAIVDLGSNSGRVVVLRTRTAGHVEVVADAHTPLRLIRGIASNRRLTPELLDSTLEALRGFRAVALGAGASQFTVVATAAVREATNADDLVSRARTELGLPVRIIDGEAEAFFGFLGAIQGLPVQHGMLIDIGGGSAQISHFRERGLHKAWTFPLGALRVSDQFLCSDPATKAEMQALIQHVRNHLRGGGLPRLTPDERLVGTGGTIRNIAKMDRKAHHSYPIPRIHGYQVERAGFERITAALEGSSASDRRSLPGLNRDRGDSILGGFLVLKTVMEHLGASRIDVSGQGLREGLALQPLTESLPPVVDVRRSSVVELAQRFTTWNADAAWRRAQLVETLREALDAATPPELSELLVYAAILLDIGRSLDFYSRWRHTASMICEADLTGFSHRSLALLAGMIQVAAEGDLRVLKHYGPLLHRADQVSLERAAAILALAEAIEGQQPAAAAPLETCQRTGREVRLAAPWLDSWPLRDVAQRLDRIFGYQLIATTSPTASILSAA